MDSSSGEELGEKIAEGVFFFRLRPNIFFRKKIQELESEYENRHPNKISWISYQLSEVYIFCVVGVARVPQRSRKAMRIERFFVVDLIEALP